MTTPAQAWESYAAQATPRRKVNAAGATMWLNWTQYPDHGPNESVLGPVGGKTVLELGSGAGTNLAHLATLGAYCTGVDLAPTRTTAAHRRWGHLPNVEFVTAEATDFLATTPICFDVVYSIFGAVWFTDPHQLLPLVRDRMIAGGVVAFSHLPAGTQAAPDNRLIAKWDHSPQRWVELLTEYGFIDATAQILPAPQPDRPGTLLVHATATQ